MAQHLIEGRSILKLHCCFLFLKLNKNQHCRNLKGHSLASVYKCYNTWQAGQTGLTEQAVRTEEEALQQLTGAPLSEDELLFAVPVVAPYSTLHHYKLLLYILYIVALYSNSTRKTYIKHKFISLLIWRIRYLTMIGHPSESCKIRFLVNFRRLFSDFKRSRRRCETAVLSPMYTLSMVLKINIF